MQEGQDEVVDSRIHGGMATHFSFISTPAAFAARCSACARVARATLPCIVCSRMRMMASSRSRWAARTSEATLARESRSCVRVSVRAVVESRRVVAVAGRLALRVERLGGGAR